MLLFSTYINATKPTPNLFIFNKMAESDMYQDIGYIKTIQVYRTVLRSFIQILYIIHVITNIFIFIEV